MKRCLVLLLLTLLVDGVANPLWGEDMPSPPVATYLFNHTDMGMAELHRAVHGTDRCGNLDSALQLYAVDYSLASVTGFPLDGASVATLSVAAWINPRQVNDYHVLVEKFDKHENQRGLRYAIKDGRLRFWWSSTGTVESTDLFDSAESDATLPVNKWSHVAVTFNEGAVRFYINGIRDSRHSSWVETIAMGNAPLGIGGNPATTDFLYDGLIDEVGIWNRVLERDEVEIMQAGGCN